MRDDSEKLFAYYRNSDVRVITEKHPNYNCVGEIFGYDQTGLTMRRYDTQATFFVQAVDLKITKRA